MSGVLYLHDLAYRQILVGGNAQCLSMMSLNPNVWYKEVTEYEGEHKTTFCYDYIINSTDIYVNTDQDIEFPIYCVRGYKNLNQPGALLKGVISYRKQSGNYVPVRKEEYTHESCGVIGRGFVYNLSVRQGRMCYECNEHEFGITENFASPEVYLTNDYYIDLRSYYVKTETVTDYQGNDSIVTRRTYNYATQDGRVLPLRSTTTTDSQGKSYTDYIYYPCDTELSALTTAAQRTALETMKQQNRILQPVVYLRKTGDRELFKRTVQYKNNGNNLLLPEKEFYKQGTNAEEERFAYTYDGKGNVTSRVKGQTDKTVYLWAYGSAYPVAKIEGATYAEVENWLGASAISSLATNTRTVPAALKDIRGKLAGKNVQVTTYTFQPLVGMTSMTAPNGEVTSYTYDPFGRLTKTTDHSGKTTETHEYNYKP